MEFVGKYKNWYKRLVDAGYPDAKEKVAEFMEAHNDIIWEKKLIKLVKSGMSTKLAMNKVSALREGFAGDNKCEKFVQTIEEKSSINTKSQHFIIKSLPPEDRLLFLKKFKTKYFENNFDELYQDLEDDCVKRGYVDNELKFIVEGKYVKAYVKVEIIM
jgi:hypothetical protein